MATVRIQLRRGEYQDWYDANPQLAAGELAIETDTNRIKIGDGSTNWRNLDYAIVNNDGTPLTTDDYGQPDGVPQLDGSGYIKSQNLPPLAKITVHSVANQAARLALTVEPGDIAIQSDTGTSYVLQSSPASTNANWKELTATQAINDAVNAAVTAMLDGAPGALNTLNELAAAIGDDPTFFTTVATNLSNHETDTTNVHGIVNTADLVTTTAIQNLLNKTLTSAIVEGGIDINGGVKFEGVTNNDYETTLIAADPTADRTITLPDNSGTVALVSNLNSYAELSGATFTGAVFGTDLNLSGNLIVSGTTTNINTTDLNVEDKNITLGDTTSPSDATADGGGFSLKGSTDKSFTWSNSTDSWTSSENIDLLDGKTYKINGNIVLSDSQVLGKSVPSGTIVGTSDTQTLTGKTIDLTDNTISGTLAEFNSAVSDADLVSLTGVETLTNKTLQSPSISSPTGILKADVGLGDVDNTSDLNKPVSTATQTALDLKSNLASPTFTGTVVLPSATSIGNVSASEIETLDGVNSNIQTQIDAKSPSASPTFTGTVVLPSTTSIGNISALQIETLDGVTSAIQTQLNAKLESSTASSTYAPIASPTFTGTVNGITKSMVGLANVDNTADTNKPVSAATQTALDLKANLDSPTFTGTVSGITATMVGLGNVDNTSDANKPVSTATQTALDLKANLDSPTFTGTVILPSTTSVGTVSNVEIGYLDGVTSAIQTQIDAKAASADVSAHTSATTSVHGISDTAQLAYKNAANQTFTGNLEVDGNMTVDGNLTVNGTTFNASATTITIEDNMVQLAHQNAANTVDLGLVVAYNDGTAKHAGIVRDVSANKWKLFEGVTDEPSTTVNFAQGTLDDLEVADITASSATIGNVSNTEIQYLDGVTSAIQTQIDSKLASATASSTYAPIASPTFTGTVTVAASGIAFTDGTQTKEGVPSRTTINSATSAYNLSTGGLSLRDTLIECNSSSAFTVTIPANSTTAYPVGTSIDLLQVGTGQITVAGAAGVTLNGTPGLKLRTQWSSATLFKRATDTWIIMGDLTA